MRGHNFGRGGWGAALAAALIAAIYFVQPPDSTQQGPENASWSRASEADMQWWREARFGLFIHWGPVSLKGTEIGWSRGGERRGREGKGEIPVEVYDSLYREFNPVQFDAQEWVRIARAAGMKYVVFTSKHHDGFCEFDSALTDYKITNSPFKRDVVKELADACHAAGMRIGFYYSQPDWHHPDYRTANHARYIEYLHGQLRELCTRYGKLDIIWFDGLGGKPEDWDAPRLIKMIRELQPGILINNRAGLPADFGTPEQHVGAFDNARAWETCMTIGDQWAWKPNDNVKSLEACLAYLVRSVGGDGNFLFNVGPMPSGAIEPRQVQRLEQMGAWLAKYGESVYGTRGGPFKPDKRTVSTHKGNTIYVHALKWAGNELRLPALSRKIVSSRLLTGGTPEVRQTNVDIRIAVKPDDRQAIDTIIRLDLDGPASGIAPMKIPSGSLTTGGAATASSVNKTTPGQTPDNAVDDEFATRWTPDAADRQPWLEVDLGREVQFNTVEIDEVVLGSYVSSFELQYRQGDEWKTIFQGSGIGRDFVRTFPGAKARRVRLQILGVSRTPSIAEFQLFMR